MPLRSLYTRIAAMFAAIVLTLGALLGWLGYNAAKQHQHEILQRVSFNLAKHVADQVASMDVATDGQSRMDALFSQMRSSSPNIDIYLLDSQGKVLRTSPIDATLSRTHVDPGAIHHLLDGAVLPILGDNPRAADASEIFSAASIGTPRENRGYIYVVLLNDMYRELVTTAWRQYMFRSSAWLALLAICVALAAGLAAFSILTRRLEHLTREVEAFTRDSHDVVPSTTSSVRETADEIERLSSAFGSMRSRLQNQMSRLEKQDELRRELVANVSHDLRTPLTSMQGYLETLQRMGEDFSDEERRQYLDVAVRQSHKVSHLVQQLFELARLECEEVLPHQETFSVAELVQDVAQKYALTAQNKSLRLSTHIDSESRFVKGDIGMIERVISNLLDNAVRHTPEHGEVRLEARDAFRGTEVCVSDNGEGIAEEQLPGLLQRGSPLRLMAVQRGGGLGLLIAKRILSLHGSGFHVASKLGHGTRISFVLPNVEVAAA